MEDFRDLLEKDEDAAIRAASREPFTEILYYWKETKKPDDKYKLYCKGIEQAVEKGRYSICHLKYVKFYPEFIKCVYEGLLKYFLARTITMVYRKNEPYLQIGRRVGMIQNVSKESLMNIIEKDQDYMIHSVDGEPKNVKIRFSSRIREVLDFLKKLKLSLIQSNKKL